MPDPSPTKRPLRVDAAENRDRLIDAALAAFATGDPEQTTLKAIAARAGVGIATLYRHFPSREALVEAAYRDELLRLVETADTLLGEHGPAEATRLWLDRFAGYVSAKRGMADTLRTVVASGAIDRSETRAGLAAGIARLLEAGARSGDFRADLDADDVLTMIAGIFLATEGDEDTRRASRLLDLLMVTISRP